VQSGVNAWINPIFLKNTPHRLNIAAAHRHISSNKHTPASDRAFERAEHDTANKNQKSPLADICNRASKKF
jgi:hypothetical protein